MGWFWLVGGVIFSLGVLMFIGAAMLRGSGRKPMAAPRAVATSPPLQVSQRFMEQWGRFVYLGIYVSVLIGLAFGHRGFWDDWWSWGARFFVWLTLGAPVLMILAWGRKGFLVTVFLLAGLIASHQLWWSEVSARARTEEVKLTVKAGGESETVTVIAPVGEWSRNFSMPPNVKWRIMPKGKVLCRTLSGKQWEDGPHQMLPKIHLESLWDRTLAFQSLKDEPVEVTIDWTR